MSLTAQVNVSVTALGITVGQVVTRTGDSGITPIDETLSAGNTSAGWTKTASTTGQVSLSPGHSIVDGKVAVYWAGGMRYNVTAATEEESSPSSSDHINQLNLSAGSGDDYPPNGTALVVAQEEVFATAFDGDNLEVIAVKLTTRGHIRFVDAGTSILKAFEFVANEPFVWCADSGAANPLTGNAVASIVVSAGTTTAPELTMTGIQNAIS